MLKIVLNIIAILALVATILPAILFLRGDISLVPLKQIMLVGTITWFAANIIKTRVTSQEESTDTA